MAITKTSSPAMDPELLKFLNGPPPQDEYGVDYTTIRENLTMSMEQRAEKHRQARLFAEALKELGEARYGELRSTDPETD